MTDIILHGVLLDDDTEFSLDEFCLACSTTTKWIVTLVEVGALDPVNYQQTSLDEQNKWKFSAYSLKRVRTAMRLQQDLGVNEAGVALILDLLEEIEDLEAKVQKLSNPIR
jgi:chaperone modulatory protein CbpM